MRKSKLLGIVRTRTGRVLVPLLLIVGVVGGMVGLKLMYVPPPLSAASLRGTPLGGYDSHASFEKECKLCHVPVRCLSANLCQDCHLDVARQVREVTGLHGMLPGTGRCQNCHTEHKGREALISAIPFINIDHEHLTGFSLARHQVDYDGSPMSCQQCHQGGRYAAESVECIACHSDSNPQYIAMHAERFGGDCMVCHDGRDRMAGFDHDRLFPLTDGHDLERCEDCHRDRAFAGMSPACGACHGEPALHAGEFGTDCARCHGAVAWVPAQLREHVFVLTHGSDETLSCQMCHAVTYTDYTCYGCHNHTPGEMQRVHVELGIEDWAACADCHPTGRPCDTSPGDVAQHESGGLDAD